MRIAVTKGLPGLSLVSALAWSRSVPFESPVQHPSADLGGADANKSSMPLFSLVHSPGAGFV
jgi:hypothetical protein